MIHAQGSKMSDLNKIYPLLSGKEIENLPSYGVGSLLSDAAGVQNFMQKINSDSKKNAGGNVLTAGSSVIVEDNGSHYKLIVEEANEQELSDSATEPIDTTLDASQIMEDEPSKPVRSGSQKPTMHVHITMDYMRFRYMSEKISQKKKGSRTRQHDTTYSDDEKHCLAELQIDNYEGGAKIIAFCAHEDRRLHPYNLFGDFCHKGVFVRRENVRRGKVLKLKRVSVTTPKEKEYDKTLTERQAYLNEAGVFDVKTSNDVKDKQIVYVLFMAVLDNGTILKELSSPIQNKKKGKEFKIEDMEPASGPATGKVDSNNVQTNRVIICVTEETNFPAEIGVKIRERDNEGKVIWQDEPESKDIMVTKQCVVRFYPPAYRNPQTPVSVEVEICLYDKKTSIETEPVKYVYYSVCDKYGLESKKRKRTLEDDDYGMEENNFRPADATKQSRKVLSGIRKGSKTNRDSDGSSSDQEASLQYMGEVPQDKTESSLIEPGLLTQALATVVSEDYTVSLQGQRNAQLPFSSYSEGQNVALSNNGTSNSQPLKQPTRPQSAGFTQSLMTASAGKNTSFLGNQSPVVTSSTSVFASTQQLVSSSSYTSAPAVSVSSQQQQYQQQQQQQVVDADQESIFLLNSEDMAACRHQGISLPKLGPNQSLAIVKGQIYIVNDDLHETTPPAAAPPTTTYQQPPIVQNIGNQQIIIQQMSPQQPVDEAEPTVMQVSMATPTSRAGYSTTPRARDQTLTRSAPLTSPVMPQSQQQQQQQQQLHLLDQLLRATGIDVYSLNPSQQQQFLQTFINLQAQSVQQTNQTVASSDRGVTCGTDLNDDDVEIDGETNLNDEAEAQLVIIVSEKTGKGSNRRSNKKLKSSNTNYTREKLSQTVTVKGNLASIQIPTLIKDDAEEDIVEQDEDARHGGKIIDYRFQNGSFGDEIDSDDEEV